MRVAIVGAGISGLATAFHLRRLRPEWTVHVYEREARPGGTMRTVEVDGFLFEAGSNGFLSNKPATLDLVEQSGATQLLLRSNDAARIRYVYTDRLHRLPTGPIEFLRTGLLSLQQRLRVLAEPLLPARRQGSEETLRQFGDRRLGAGFTDAFLDPMAAGIFASTPEQLSVEAAFPAVVALERDYGGLFRGMIARRRREAGPAGVLMSFRGGVSRFVDHLARLMGDDLHCGMPIEGLEHGDGNYRLSCGGSQIPYDQLVLATPAYVSAELLRPLDAALATRLDAIRYSPIAVVGFGYRSLDHPLQGFGLLTTRKAGQKILGVLWDSSIFPDRAPAGCKSLRVMIGGQRQPELGRLDERSLIDTARDGVAAILGVDTPPAVTFVQRWPRGIPNYPVGHLDNVDAIFAGIDKHRGLHLTGNAYRGIGINDCVANAVRCAERLAG